MGVRFFGGRVDHFLDCFFTLRFSSHGAGDLSVPNVVKDCCVKQSRRLSDKSHLAT